MCVIVKQIGSILVGEPQHWLQKSPGQIEPDDPMIARRNGLVVLIGWLHLFVLTIVQGFIAGNQMVKRFLSVFAVDDISLIAAPIFILAEAGCIQPLNRITHHFEPGIVYRVRVDSPAAQCGHSGFGEAIDLMEIQEG